MSLTLWPKILAISVGFSRPYFSEFLVLTLNLLAGLTPSVEIKIFRKLMKQSGSHAS